MTRITSYFNPISKEHHAFDNFKNLSGGKKFLTVVLTALAAIASLPILGLGGVATFRALTNQFTIIDPNKETISQKAKTAQKTNLQFHEQFKTCSKEEAIEIIQEKHPDLNAKDASGNTLIHIACQRSDPNFDEVIEKMLNEEDANFDERNSNEELPITSYSRTHRRQVNQDIHEKMLLKMNQIEFLEGYILEKDNPDFLRKALDKLSKLGKPYQLKANSNTTELFVVLLERAQTDKEVRDIIKCYQNNENHLSFDENQSTDKQVDDLTKAIKANEKFTEEKKTEVLNKINRK